MRRAAGARRFGDGGRITAAYAARLRLISAPPRRRGQRGGRTDAVCSARTLAAWLFTRVTSSLRHDSGRRTLVRGDDVLDFGRPPPRERGGRQRHGHDRLPPPVASVCVLSRCGAAHVRTGLATSGAFALLLIVVNIRRVPTAVVPPELLSNCCSLPRTKPAAGAAPAPTRGTGAKQASTLCRMLHQPGRQRFSLAGEALQVGRKRPR